MRARRLTFATLLLATAAASARGEPMGCLIQPYQEAEVGARAVGIVDRVLVERGDFVKKGQPVAQLNADVERVAVAAAKLRAQATAELQAAASSHDFAQKKKVRTQDLFKQNFVSQQVKDQAATEADVAQMRLNQAREQLRQAQQELALSNAQLAQRTIRSPMDGVIVERYVQEGERVEEKPVLRIAAIDPLRVEVIVRATYFNKIKQGMSASVQPDVADVELYTAKVVVVDRVIDPASNSFRVRLELANPANALPAGLRCKVEFDGLQGAEAGAVDATGKPGSAAGGKSDAGAARLDAEQHADKRTAEAAGAKPASRTSVAAARTK